MFLSSTYQHPVLCWVWCHLEKQPDPANESMASPGVEWSTHNFQGGYLRLRLCPSVCRGHLPWDEGLAPVPGATQSSTVWERRPSALTIQQGSPVRKCGSPAHNYLLRERTSMMFCLLGIRERNNHHYYLLPIEEIKSLRKPWMWIYFGVPRITVFLQVFLNKEEKNQTLT